jgi:hypothetical protein
MIRKWLKSVHGEHLASTGKAWIPRNKLKRLVQREGGIPTEDAEVTRATTVLVKGKSSAWAYGDYGTKELDAARLTRKGASISIVHDLDFRRLIEKVAACSRGRRGRLEQGYLRSKLFGIAEVATCSLCGLSMPVSLLVAAHIKPRSECSRSERLDADNIVASMCLLAATRFTSGASWPWARTERYCLAALFLLLPSKMPYADSESGGAMHGVLRRLSISVGTLKDDFKGEARISDRESNEAKRKGWN